MSHEDHIDSTMKMWFHFGKEEIILFEFWNTKSTPIFLLSLLIIFLMSFTYEGLKHWRQRIQQNHAERLKSSLIPEPSSSIISQVFTGFHLVQTLFHMLQFVLSYFLMLIFMTYNVWFGLALTLGVGAGYLCFGGLYPHSYSSPAVSITSCNHQ